MPISALRAHGGESCIIVLSADTKRQRAQVSSVAKEVAERREREAFDAALEAARTKIKAFADSIARFAEATLAGMDELIARQRRVPAIRDEVRWSASVPHPEFSTRTQAIHIAVERSLRRMRQITHEEPIGEGNGGPDAMYYERVEGATRSVESFGSRDLGDMARYLWCHYSARGADEKGYYFPYFETDRVWLGHFLERHNSWICARNSRHGGPLYDFLNRDFFEQRGLAAMRQVSPQLQPWAMNRTETERDRWRGVENAVQIIVCTMEGGREEFAAKPSDLEKAYNNAVGASAGTRWRFFKEGDEEAQDPVLWLRHQTRKEPASDCGSDEEKERRVTLFALPDADSRDFVVVPLSQDACDTLVEVLEKDMGEADRRAWRTTVARRDFADHPMLRRLKDGDTVAKSDAGVVKVLRAGEPDETVLSDRDFVTWAMDFQDLRTPGPSHRAEEIISRLMSTVHGAPFVAACEEWRKDMGPLAWSGDVKEEIAPILDEHELTALFYKYRAREGQSKELAARHLDKLVGLGFFGLYEIGKV